MENKPLSGMKVAVLVTDGFEQVEMTGPRDALEKAGAVTSILSPNTDKVQGFNHFERAESFRVDIVLKDADPGDFDAVLLPGGAINADTLRMIPEAQEFIRAIDGKNKPIAVICHGSWLLVSAGLVNGKTITSYHTIRDDLRNAGANWVDRETVRDGNWVSSRSPKDIPAFNNSMIDLFAEYGGSQVARSHEEVSESKRGYLH